MKSETKDKESEIFLELEGEFRQNELLQIFDKLDQYTISAPSKQDTKALIAAVKPCLPQSTSLWQLLQPQWMLINRSFVMGTVFSVLLGLALTNLFAGNTLHFLVNASPLLGILTIFYTFRAQQCGVYELEAACPYTPAQIATARLLVVLGYDILLCLLATPIVIYWQGDLFWQVIIGWLAPLVFVLGTALATSLRFGITSGCCLSMVAWALQLKTGKDTSVLTALLSNHSLVFFDCVSLLVGIGLLWYVYKKWESVGLFQNADFHDSL